jgi:hypothetical protein
MKIFFNDFTVFSDLLTHLEKLKKIFLKCREFGISLNQTNVFIVFSGTILNFLVSNEGKFMDPKMIETLVNMLVLTTLNKSKFSMGRHNFMNVLSKKLPPLCHQLPNCSKSLKFLSGLQNVKMFGRRLRTNM